MSSSFYFGQLIYGFPVFMQVVMTWSVQCLTWEKDSAVYSCLTKRWLCLALPSFYLLVIIFFLFLAHTYAQRHKHVREEGHIVLRNHSSLFDAVLSLVKKAPLQDVHFQHTHLTFCLANLYRFFFLIIKHF